MAGTPLRHLAVFKKLCGTDALKKVIFVTTMWDTVTDDEGEIRERELRERYWKPMMKKGSTIARFSNTTQSAWSVVKPLIDDANRRFGVRLQSEMVDLKKQLPDTKAGMELHKQLDAIIPEYRKVLQQIREKIPPDGSEHDMAKLRREAKECRRKLEQFLADVKRLEPVSRMPLILRLLSPLGLTR